MKADIGKSLHLLSNASFFKGKDVTFISFRKLLAMILKKPINSVQRCFKLLDAGSKQQEMDNVHEHLLLVNLLEKPG